MAATEGKQGVLAKLSSFGSKSNLSGYGNGNISLKKLLSALAAISLGTIIECESRCTFSCTRHARPRAHTPAIACTSHPPLHL